MISLKYLKKKKKKELR